MSSILITGSKSFIGENFKKFSEYKEITEVSIREVSPASIDFNGVDVVLHLSALVHSYGEKAYDYYYVNRDLCIDVARNAKAKGVRQFIFMSTAKVYGDFRGDIQAWNESSVCDPTDHYGKSKYQAETGLLELADRDFIISIIRTPVVYGPGVRGNILKLIRLIEKFPVLPFSKIKNQRSFTFAGNLVAYIDKIINLRASGIFIAMDERSVSTTLFIEFLSKHLNKKIVLFRIPGIFIKAASFFKPEIFEPLFGSSILDNSATKKMLDFRVPYSMDEGINIMINQYKSSGK